MSRPSHFKSQLTVMLGPVLTLLFSPALMAQQPAELMAELKAYPHTTTVAESVEEVIDHEVGLGAMRKTRSVWQFKSSERLSGSLARHTWQVVDGFTSLEVYEAVKTRLTDIEDSELLFSCVGRSCGHGAQWANRVFGQRVLYGREDLQQYSVYGLTGDPQYRVIIYSSARTADRQYLHMEILTILP